MPSISFSGMCSANAIRLTDQPSSRASLNSSRLSPGELTTLKKITEQQGLTLPSALRAGFLRHAEHCG
jgi:hypothetical protein